MKYLFSCTSEVWYDFWDGNNKITTYLNCKTRVIQMISGVSRHTTCTHIFKDYNILTVASLYMLEVGCYIKKYKNWLEQNVHIHNYKTWKTMDLHIQFCNTDLFRNLWGIWELRLYNKMPVHIKKNWRRPNHKRTEILSVITCILFSGWIYAILLVCALYDLLNVQQYMFCFTSATKTSQTVQVLYFCS